MAGGGGGVAREGIRVCRRCRALHRAASHLGERGVELERRRDLWRRCGAEAVRWGLGKVRLGLDLFGCVYDLTNMPLDISVVYD